jgi:precorrin-3B synthase
MTRAATNLVQRRGACPGLSVPMQSGDGLLARLRPTGTISLSGVAGLCAAARQFGNGVVEVTSRGSIQIRGLTAASAPRFADAVAALAIAADDGIPVHCNALAGLDAEETFDAASVASALRRTLARTSLPTRLSPKVSVAIDGGGSLDLDGLAADVRLRAGVLNGGVLFQVGVAGDAAVATSLGAVTSKDAAEAARRLLEVIARYGHTARARDVLATEGAAPFETTLAGLIVTRDSSVFANSRPTSDPIHSHLLRDGSFACGVGLAFGHTDAYAIAQLTQAARSTGALGFRTAPGRVLLAIGVRPADTAAFAATAEQLAFVAHPGDPRRYVIACAGAPICAAAHMPSRTLAPVLTAAAQKYLGDDFRIHISGCAKGCAHAGPASLTVVGRTDGCAVISNGLVSDDPVALTTVNELPSMIAELARSTRREAGYV